MALRIICNNSFFIIRRTFAKDKSVIVHQRIPQIPATQMCKILHGLSLDIMLYDIVFETRIKYYNTPNAPIFSSRNVKIVR